MAFEALKRGAAFVTLVARNEVSNRNMITYVYQYILVNRVV